MSTQIIALLACLSPCNTTGFLIPLHLCSYRHEKPIQYLTPHYVLSFKFHASFPPTCQCISSGSSQNMRASLIQASRTISEPPAHTETLTDTPQPPSSRPTPINAQHVSTISIALCRKISGQTLLECYPSFLYSLYYRPR